MIAQVTVVQDDGSNTASSTSGRLERLRFPWRVCAPCLGGSTVFTCLGKAEARMQ